MTSLLSHPTTSDTNKSDQRHKIKSLASDVSFTNEDFKDMNLSKVGGGHANRKEVTGDNKIDARSMANPMTRIPKLRFRKIRGLKLSILNIFSRTNHKDSEAFLEILFSDESFSSHVFELLDLNGDGILQTEEILQLASKKGPYPMDLFKDTFRNLLVVYSGGFDVITRDLFHKVWSGKNLHKHVNSAIEESPLSLDVIMTFVILFTNSREITAERLQDLARLKSMLRDLEDPLLGITLQNMRDVLSDKHPWLVDRAFELISSAWDEDSISSDDVGYILLHFLGQTDETKVENAQISHTIALNPSFQVFFLYTLFDKNETGVLTCSDLHQVLLDSVTENGVIFDQEELEQLVKVMMEECLQERVCNGDAGIRYHDMRNLLKFEKDLAPSLASSLDKWLVPVPEKRDTSFFKIPERLTMRYMRNNIQDVTFLIILFLVLIVLFCIRAGQFLPFKNVNGETIWFIVFARGFGLCLNFLVPCLFILMCRPVLTYLRTHKISEIFPIDNHIFYHKLIGILVIVFSAAHALAHLINIEHNFRPHIREIADMNNLPLDYIPENLTYADWLLTDRSQMFGLISGWGYPTGFWLTIVLISMGIGSLPWVRNKGHFEVFYFSHLCYVVFVILMILHCENSWMFLMIPVTMFVWFKFLMVFKWYEGTGKTHVVSGVLLPSRVTQLIIRRKPDFKFRPGDWIFINIPAISVFEWHPFTISSAPEQSDFLTLHIRSLGGWTRRLHEYFIEEDRLIQKENSSQRGQKRHKTSIRKRLLKNIRAMTGFRRQVRPSPTENHVSKFDEEELNIVNYSLKSSPLKAKQNMEDVFSVIFDPNEDPHNLWTGFRFLQFEPRKILYDEPEECTYLSKENDHTNFPSRIPSGKSMTRPQTTHAKHRKPLEIFLDGPHGAPSSSIFEAEHAVLVATGIGVTPFASILQSVMYRYWKSKNTCPQCNHKWSEGLNPEPGMRLKKVDFIWINREQRAFEWFLQLLSQLEIEQAERCGNFDKFLDVHLYITSVLPATDFRAVTLHLALDLMHKKTKRDQITGLKSRTKAGRPNWDDLFYGFSKANHGKVTVFYCGNPGLSSILLKKCNDYKFSFKKEIF